MTFMTALLGSTILVGPKDDGNGEEREAVPATIINAYLTTDGVRYDAMISTGSILEQLTADDFTVEVLADAEDPDEEIDEEARLRDR